MKKIVLMGNPNTGKSVVFSRLTGAMVISSNYPGTTVDYSKGKMRLGSEVFEIIDAPGTYSLQPSNKAEEVAAEFVQQAEFVINVVDATNLERNLFLTLELLEGNKPLVIALNMWDDAKRSGINIDVEGLERLLGVPIVPTVALTGEGIKDLVNRLGEAHSPKGIKPTSDEARWIEIGHITKNIQTVIHKHPTIWHRFSDATIKPITGIPIAICIIFVSFLIVILIGEALITFIFEPLFEFYRPVAMGMSDWIGPGFIHDLLIGKLIGGEIDYAQSMGILTTGLFVPFGIVLPYIVSFYLMLGLLEDTGYLPRLATLTDSVFHKLGIHGYGIIPLFLGLGCNVPGVLSIRLMETRKQRFIAATLMAIAVPCMAQTAMVFGILGPYGLIYILMVFLALGIVYIVVGLILNRYVKGESPEIFLEIPPYRRPYFMAILKKTWMRIKWFLSEAIPFLFLGVLLINVLFTVGFLDFIGNVFSPVMEGWFGLEKEATTALLVGFLRKDLAVGMLLPLGMAPVQLVVATVVLSMYFPCVATFAILLKELGLKDMFKSVALMMLTVFIVGGILRLLLIGF